MKNFVSIFSISAALLLPSTDLPAQTATSGLALREVLSEVESANLSVLAAQEDVLAAVENVRRERAGLLPQATAVAGQSRNQTVSVGLGLEEFGLSRQSDPFNRFNAGIEVSAPLLDLNQIALYQNAKHESEIARYRFAALLEDFKLAASETFVANLRAREGHALAEASLARAERLKKIVADRLEAGAANPIDLSRAKLEVSAARQAILEREATLVEADQQLKLFLNRDLSSSVEPVALYLNAEGELSRQPNVSFGEVLQRRSDYLAQLEEEDRAKLLVKAAGWQRLPSLNAYGNYGYVAESAFDGDEESDWNIGISFSVPIFEGFRTKADKRIAKAALLASERRLSEIEKRVGVELRTTWERLRVAQARYAVGVENLQLAQETFRLAEDRFKNGATDNRELVEAQLGLDQAETNLLDLRLLHVLARLRFARATGSVESVFESI